MQNMQSVFSQTNIDFFFNESGFFSADSESSKISAFQ